MNSPAFSINELKSRIDLHDLATKLGWKRPDKSGNYSSPNRKDKNPSISIFKSTQGDQLFKDHTTGEGGSCIDMIIYDSAANDVMDAVLELHNIYNFPMKKKTAQQRKEMTDIERWAQGCLKNQQGCKPYLMNERKISEKVVNSCIKQNTLGWNTYTSTRFQPGERFYGGDGVAFITKSFNTREVVNFETRYVDPQLNGGLKTQCQGEKTGHLYIPDLARFKAAKTVIIVESPINALTALSVLRQPVAAVATRGVGNLDLNWEVLSGKHVLVCFDNDDPIDAEGGHKGHRPGPEAAWKIHDILTELRISCLFIDQTTQEWKGINDLNDYLIEYGDDKTRFALNRIEKCLIPGLHISKEFEHIKIKRHYLEPHNANIYWKHKVAKNHTFITSETIDGEGRSSVKTDDLCGFRIAKSSKVLIQSDNATINNSPDHEPESVYVATCEIPREGGVLQTQIFDNDQFHEISLWKKFGAIIKPAQFSRLLTLLESTITTNGTKTVNFVGLAWRNGKVIINESKDCYFEDKSQCTYDRLTFPSGSKYDAKKVVEAYHKTFKDNAATFLLTWALGAHLKPFLGFWPHMILEAEKGAGKSVLEGRLSQTLAMKKFSGQQIQTEWRILTALSYTSHPVIWEELSARSTKVIGQALSMLQEAYNYSPSTRGSKQLKYMLSAPVCMGGEEVEAKTLLGKVVRTNINDKKGDMLPIDLPAFPVREWLGFLAGMDEKHVHDIHTKAKEHCIKYCAGNESDDGAERIVSNFASILLAWKLLCEFINIPQNSFGFITDIITEMNTFLNDSESDRHPWVWIIATIFNEIDAGNYRHPYCFGTEGESEVIYLRCSHIMSHMATSPNLRQEFDALPIKGHRVLKQQLKRAEIFAKDGVDKRIGNKRIPRMQAFSLEKLKEFGLTVSVPDTQKKGGIV